MHKSIGQVIQAIWKHIATRATFFWFSVCVFMAVSLLHAGLYFSILEPQTGLWWWAFLGYAVALVFDLATIVFLQALLAAQQRGDVRKVWLNLLFITICAGLSTLANLSVNLNDRFEIARFLHNAPLWIQESAPYIGAIFPALVIMISLAGDMMMTSGKEDVEAYKTELKRVRDFLDARREHLSEMVSRLQEMALLKRQERDAHRTARGKLTHAEQQQRWELRQKYGPWLARVLHRSRVPVEDIQATIKQELDMAIQVLSRQYDTRLREMASQFAATMQQMKVEQEHQLDQQIWTMQDVLRVHLNASLVDLLSKIEQANVSQFDALNEQIQGLSFMVQQSRILTSILEEIDETE